MVVKIKIIYVQSEIFFFISRDTYKILELNMQIRDVNYTNNFLIQIEI